MSKKFKFKVTFAFTKDDIETILRDANDLCIRDENNPITFKEFKKNKKMQKYLAKELQGSQNEIVEGSREAIANDWLYDIEAYR